MRKATSLALVAEGRLSRSYLARLPGLREHLAFVKSRSLWVASRLANNLKAGIPVDDYESLEECAVFLVCVPEARFELTLGEMAASDIAWRGRVVVLWSSERTSAEAAVLRERGAAPCSIAQIDQRRFVVEGQRSAVRNLRSLFASSSIHWLEVRPELKPLFLGGVSIASRLTPKLISAALECFRAAGLTGPEAQEVAEAMFAGGLRGVLKGGRLRTERIPATQEEALARYDPALAKVLGEIGRLH